MMRHLDVGPFGGDRQNPLGDAERGGIGGSDVMDADSNDRARVFQSDAAQRPNLIARR
ncbi:hypothetical protein [Bradyrhizobium nanningense]|uniref:hypothetical protein n=1 Tax=Bradyrhizobium nanningense TaxID=1325118 RepID=UPI001FE14998|nr:hypothetical protein [Bradyrhizobium nanningense]